MYRGNLGQNEGFGDWLQRDWGAVGCYIKWPGLRVVSWEGKNWARTGIRRKSNPCGYWKETISNKRIARAGLREGMQVWYSPIHQRRHMSWVWSMWVHITKSAPTASCGPACRTFTFWWCSAKEWCNLTDDLKGSLPIAAMLRLDLEGDTTEAGKFLRKLVGGCEWGIRVEALSDNVGLNELKRLTWMHSQYIQKFKTKEWVIHGVKPSSGIAYKLNGNKKQKFC